MSRKPQRTKEQKELILTDIARYKRHGFNNLEIARKLGMDEKQVRRDWSELLKRLAAEEIADVKVARQSLLEEYRSVKGQAWKGWWRSKKDKQKTTAEKITSAGTDGGDDGQAETVRTKAVKTVEGRLPDCSYLKEIRSCLDAERILRDLNPAKKHELSGPGGGPIEFILVPDDPSESPAAAETPAAAG